VVVLMLRLLLLLEQAVTVTVMQRWRGSIQGRTTVG